MQAPARRIAPYWHHMIAHGVSRGKRVPYRDTNPVGVTQRWIFARRECRPYWAWRCWECFVIPGGFRPGLACSATPWLAIPPLPALPDPPSSVGSYDPRSARLTLGRVGVVDGLTSRR